MCRGEDTGKPNMLNDGIAFATSLGVPQSIYPLPTSSATCDHQTLPRAALDDQFLGDLKLPKAQSMGITGLNSSSPWHRDEARILLGDLSNFIPLGCLTSATELSLHGDAPEWSELFHLPNLPELLLRRLAFQDLISAGWIRVFARSGHSATHGTVIRIYLLAGDVGHRFIDRTDKLAKARREVLRCLIAELDSSPLLWKGIDDGRVAKRFDMWATGDQSSLHWIFNNNPSPAPDVTCVKNASKRHAIQQILHQSSLRGLKTRLYPYQRRSAAFMLQRESESRKYLDPRLERRTSPDGSIYYYCAREFTFLLNPIFYEAGKGGILAETMGLGKTVIALSLILSTKGVLPAIPVQYSVQKPSTVVRSLMDICVDNINRQSLPWKNFFEQREEDTGESYDNLVARLQASKCSYEIPRIPLRFNRTTTIPPPTVKTLAATTIIVVPRNLCTQWQAEIEKHTEHGSLTVLVMNDLRADLPPPDEMRQYDIILFSRNRFEQEIRDGSDRQGRRFSKTPLSCACPYIKATRTRDCTCLRPEDLYDSPLKQLHFLRIIIDEGHSFSASTTMAPLVAERLVTADHRWVVSGTPAKDLLGVEMDLYSSDQAPLPLNDKTQRDKILAQRKQFNANDDTQGAVRNLGSLVTHFLRIRPWSSGNGDPGAAWEEYIYRHEDSRKRTFSSFSRALRQTIEAVLIKTRPEDVERDIELPPLTHTIVKLKPSFYDKITANLFTLVLTSNAVTSERSDRDYLFHKDSTAARYQLISNLRQSTFFWTGFSASDITKAIELSEKYIEEKGENCSEEDRILLQACTAMAKRVIDSRGWNRMSVTHELGIFLKAWPEDSAEHWTFDRTEPLLTGVTMLSEAQDHVMSQLSVPDVDATLSGEGVRSMTRATTRGVEETNDEATKRAQQAKSGAVTASGLTGESSRKNHSALKKRSKGQTTDWFVASLYEDSASPSPSTSQSSSLPSTSISTSTSAPAPPPSLPADSPLNPTRITGTVSAKLSYLLSQIILLSPHEKILIFYSSDPTAYYISQSLEILHIPYLIYARSLPAHLKSSWIVEFNIRKHFRVMLMDVGQAAYGLNVSCASRVFFVNPVCRPALEAQAIKRAHRIGQEREVRVETLVLEGTIEEGIWERSRRMSRAEHARAKVLEDDGGVKDVIVNARLLDVEDGEDEVARLEGDGEKVWCRDGWEGWEDGKWLKGGGGRKRKRSSAGEEVGGGGKKKRKGKGVGFAVDGV